MFLKLGTSGVAMFLICAFFLLLLKDPDTQMTCNTPKIWPHFGCNKHIFRLFSSILFWSGGIVFIRQGAAGGAALITGPQRSPS